MRNVRRYYTPNSIVFITVVTNHRYPYLKDDKVKDIFWGTLHEIQTTSPFNLLAYTIIPDHFHWLMAIPDGSTQFSQIIKRIKRNTTMKYKSQAKISGEFHLWQNRYWDHVIRDEDDLQHHFDYIHWNPVKHGYVDDPEFWHESSFEFWVRKGIYQPGWKHTGDDKGVLASKYD